MRRFLADVLTWPGNRQYITAIKAARDYSVPPTVLILQHRQPSDGWSPIDKKLAIAFQILEDETCSECGVPIWLGHSDDEDIVFEIKSRTCYSCAEIETSRERDEKRKKKRDEKGEKHFIDNKTSHIHTRAEYYEAEAAKMVE